MRTLPTLFRSFLGALFLIAVQAQAAVYVDKGDTTGAPTYTRALADFSGLSGAGVDVSYNTFSFSVDTDGLYKVRSFALPLTGAWDNYLFLYAGSFDPSAPLLNGLAGNDDFNATIGRSGFDVNLSTGTNYVLVTTGFAPTDFGRYANLIAGPGMVVTSPVPEPETLALFCAGLGILGLAMRRRTS